MTDTVILASRYNNLRQRTNTILGQSQLGNPTSGYGQTFNYTDVIGSRTNLETASTITAQQYKELYLDIIRIRIHQVGLSSVNIDPFVVGDYNTNGDDTDKVELAYVEALESLATNIESDKFTIDESTQADLQNLRTVLDQPIATTRLQSLNGTWQGSINHIFDVKFESGESRRHFFNSGGKVRVSAEVDYAGSQPKSVQWQNAITAMGTISFAANSTFSSAGVGVGSNFGNYQINNSYTKIYRNQVSGTYGRNFYNLYAFNLNETTIRFKAEFFDGPPNDVTYGIDEVVFGDFSSKAQLIVPNGTATINGVLTDTVVYSDAIVGITQSNL